MIERALGRKLIKPSVTFDRAAEVLFIVHQPRKPVRVHPFQGGELVCIAKDTERAGQARKADLIGKGGHDAQTPENVPDFGLGPGMHRAEVINMTTPPCPVPRVSPMGLKGRIVGPCGALFGAFACDHQGTAAEKPVLSPQGAIGHLNLEARRTPAHGQAG